MRQHISKEQWDELNRIEQKIIQKSLSIDYDPDLIPNIGQMIEYLGDDWFVIRNQITKTMLVEAKPFGIGSGYEKKELCDALFEAVKYKVKNI